MRRKQKKEKSLKERILDHLIKGPTSDVALECDVCKTQIEAKKFRGVLEEMIKNKIIDWHPLDKKTPKDESVPYGEFLRIYHIARPSFISYTF